MAKLNWSRARRIHPMPDLTMDCHGFKYAPLRQDRDEPRGPRPSARALACQRAHQARVLTSRAG